MAKRIDDNPYPTREERLAAQKVLQEYAKLAQKILKGINQEQVNTWITSLDTCVKLLGSDPDLKFKAYACEYAVGSEE